MREAAGYDGSDVEEWQERAAIMEPTAACLGTRQSVLRRCALALNAYGGGRMAEAERQRTKILPGMPDALEKARWDRKRRRRSDEAPASVREWIEARYGKAKTTKQNS